MKYVNIHPFDIVKKKFGANFNPSHLHFACNKKAQMTESVVNILKKIAKIFSSNLVKNVDGLLNKEPKDTDVKWIGKNKSCLPENKYKVTY